MRYVALLRGVNVGGKGKLNMKEACATLGALGLGNVASYIQSGNILFSSDKSEEALETLVRSAFESRFELAIRSAEDMARIAGSDPFKEGRQGDPRPYVTFLHHAPPEIDLPLFSPKRDVETFRVDGREAYGYVFEGGAVSGFPATYFERKLKIPTTTRNWTVVNAIARLLTE